MNLIFQILSIRAGVTNFSILGFLKKRLRFDISTFNNSESI